MDNRFMVHVITIRVSKPINKFSLTIILQPRPILFVTDRHPTEPKLPLKGEYIMKCEVIDKLRNMCEALEIKFNKENTIQDLCNLVEKERPDLMRGRGWNMLRKRECSLR